MRRMQSGLRLKLLSPTRRKDFFAHLKELSRFTSLITFRNPANVRLSVFIRRERGAYSPNATLYSIRPTLYVCSDGFENCAENF
jgi:hypothetical protein